MWFNCELLFSADFYEKYVALLLSTPYCHTDIVRYIWVYMGIPIGYQSCLSVSVQWEGISNGNPISPSLVRVWKHYSSGYTQCVASSCGAILLQKHICRIMEQLYQLEYGQITWERKCWQRLEVITVLILGRS